MIRQHDQTTELVTDQIELSKTALTLEQLSFLNEIAEIKNGTVTLERGLRGTRLKTEVAFPLDHLTQLGEAGLAEYIVTSLVGYRPAVIPRILENESLINLATQLLRTNSGSRDSLRAYTSDVCSYCDRLKSEPDQVIADVKRSGRIDPDKLEKHRGFIDRLLAEKQDNHRAPGRLIGFSRHIRSWYAANDIDLPKPKNLPRRQVRNKDRAPSQETLQRLIDMASLRDKVIIAMLALGGFREGTLVRLKYSHVKADIEAGRIPVHIHVEADEQKGEYGDYDTFLGQEAVDYLTIYLDERKRGTIPQWKPPGSHSAKYLPPETITDDSPLIRTSQDATPRSISEKAVYKAIHSLYYRAGLLHSNENGHYDLRIHTIRKFFKTQLEALGVKSDYVDYMMGHVIDTYHDIQSKGPDFLRSIYSKAGLTIRPKNQLSKLDRVKQFLRDLDLEPEKILLKDAFSAEPHRILGNQEDQDDNDTRVLVRALVDYLKQETRNSSQNSSNI